METTVYVENQLYYVSSSHYHPGWVEATKTLPFRAWNKQMKLWIVPCHSVTVDALRALYGPFGTVNVKEGSRASSGVNETQIRAKYPFLHPFQAETVANIINKGSYLVAFDLGLGKTMTGLAAAREIMLRDNKKLLIIAPDSTLKQWQNEAKRWFNMQLLIIKGTKKKREKLWNMLDDIKIISHETFRMDWKDIAKPHLNAKTIVIGDELSKIKSQSQLYKVFREMGAVVANRVGLTGTPLTGKLDHYYRIMSWVHNGTWMVWKEFDERFVVKDWVTIHGGERKLVVVGWQNLPDFVQRLEGYVDRKSKHDLKDQLPPRTISWRMIGATQEQKRVFENMLEYARGTDEGILSVYTLCHQIADGLDVLAESTSEILARIPPFNAEESPKLLEIWNILEEIGDKKVIIFTDYARFARRIQRYLNTKANSPIALLATAQDTKERDESVQRFHSDPNVRILVATNTLARGYDAPDIDYLINADISPDVDPFFQRMERIWRMSSKLPKTVINLYSEGLEEDIKDIIEKKATLSELVLEGKVLQNVNIQDELEKKYGIPNRGKKIKKRFLYK